jgi:hypothetical protein
MRNAFAYIDQIAQCGEDIALAADADKRLKYSLEDAHSLNKRLSRWIPLGGKDMGTFKKPKRPKAWWFMVAIVLVVVLIVVF